MLRYLSLVILAFSCHALNADVVWPTPLDDFALGRNPESFLQPTASGNPTSGAFVMFVITAINFMKVLIFVRRNAINVEKLSMIFMLL